MSNVVLELDEIMELLLEAKVKGSMEDTACRWVRDNRERWQQWIASETSCTEGHGLVSLNGAFVRNRSQAWMKNGANDNYRTNLWATDRVLERHKSLLLTFFFKF